jgi:hypothetical protein
MTKTKTDRIYYRFLLRSGSMAEGRPVPSRSPDMTRFLWRREYVGTEYAAFVRSGVPVANGYSITTSGTAWGRKDLSLEKFLSRQEMEDSLKALLENETF